MTMHERSKRRFVSLPRKPLQQFPIRGIILADRTQPTDKMRQRPRLEARHLDGPFEGKSGTPIMMGGERAGGSFFLDSTKREGIVLSLIRWAQHCHRREGCATLSL